MRIHHPGEVIRFENQETGEVRDVHLAHIWDEEEGIGEGGLWGYGGYTTEFLDSLEKEGRNK